MKNSSEMSSTLIAPCGINCNVCMAHLRKTNKCSGCNGNDNHKSVHCVKCVIKNCEALKDSELNFCYICTQFPCIRLKKLDKRYRTKYMMSPIENLEIIKKSGLEYFINREKTRWACSNCGGVICVHRGCCSVCGEKTTAQDTR